MKAIRILSDKVANQIAAGEVVERPVSVVRELVDNSLDAGASRIEVALENGGKSLIRVFDNGGGMTAEELRLAIRRHATSKLIEIEDLNAIATRGFRGEALAAITEVSRTRFISRKSDAGHGHEYSLDGSAVLRDAPISAPPGTLVEVRSLFCHVPARRKFLKSDKTEEDKIRTWLERAAIIAPQVAFVLKNEQRALLDLAPQSHALDRAVSLFKGDLLRFEREWADISVAGALGAPSQASTRGEPLTIFVNGRLVVDRMLVRAVKEGFHSMLKGSETPLGVILIEMSGEAVDINVHPQKSEVRFAQSQRVFGAVQQAVSAAMRRIHAPGVPISAKFVGGGSFGGGPEFVGPEFVGPEFVTRADLAGGEVEAGGYTTESVRGTFSGGASEPGMLARDMPSDLLVAAKAPNYHGVEVNGLEVHSVEVHSLKVHSVEAHRDQDPFVGYSASSVNEASQGTLSLFGAQLKGSLTRQQSQQLDGFHQNDGAFHFSELRFLAQTLGCFLLCEYRDQLVVIDMHAAHERVNFFKIRSALDRSGVATQRLLFPLRISLLPSEIERLQREGDLLVKLGFDLKWIGEEELMIEGAPAILQGVGIERFFRDLSAFYEESSVAQPLSEKLDEIAARLACHASVRSGDRLNAKEVQVLLNNLDETPIATACPHGRPIIASFSRRQVELWFNRD